MGRTEEAKTVKGFWKRCIRRAPQSFSAWALSKVYPQISYPEAVYDVVWDDPRAGSPLQIVMAQAGDWIRFAANWAAEDVQNREDCSQK